MTGWAEANQRRLMGEVARVKAALRRHAGGDSEGDEADARAAAAGAEPWPDRLPPAALDAVAHAFGLSPFERDVLVLCAAVELDGGVAGLCAAAHGDRERARFEYERGLRLRPADPHARRKLAALARPSAAPPP